MNDSGNGPEPIQMAKVAKGNYTYSSQFNCSALKLNEMYRLFSKADLNVTPYIVPKRSDGRNKISYVGKSCCILIKTTNDLKNIFSGSLAGNL